MKRKTPRLSANSNLRSSFQPAQRGKPQTENPLRFSKAFHLVRLALDDDRWSSRTPQKKLRNHKKSMYNSLANGYSAPLLKQETTIDSEIKGILCLFNSFFFFFSIYVCLSERVSGRFPAEVSKRTEKRKTVVEKHAHKSNARRRKKISQTWTKPAPKKEKKTWLCEEASVKEAESMLSSPEASRQRQKLATKRRIKERSEKIYMRARAPTNNNIPTKGASETWPQAAGEEEETTTPRAISNKIQN